MKRKLDDVARRLESLYDLLRENRVIIKINEIKLCKVKFMCKFKNLIFSVVRKHTRIFKSNGAINTNR